MAQTGDELGADRIPFHRAYFPGFAEHELSRHVGVAGDDDSKAVLGRHLQHEAEWPAGPMVGGPIAVSAPA